MAGKETFLAKEALGKKIAGEIVLSVEPGKTIRKWRNIFKFAQRQLALSMGVMPSVISDYESGRRKSPGVGMIKKIVTSLLELDEKQGGKITKEFNSLYSTEFLNDAVLDMKEIPNAISLSDFSRIIDGSFVVGEEQKDKKIYGYTIIDSLKAIIDLSPTELVRLYGLTTERALIFTKVQHGRSPLIAIKVTNLKPGVVVFHNLKGVDAIAKRIATVEGIPVINSKLSSADELIRTLREKI